MQFCGVEEWLGDCFRLPCAPNRHACGKVSSVMARLLNTRARSKSTTGRVRAWKLLDDVAVPYGRFLLYYSYFVQYCVLSSRNEKRIEKLFQMSGAGGDHNAIGSLTQLQLAFLNDNGQI